MVDRKQVNVDRKQVDVDCYSSTPPPPPRPPPSPSCNLLQDFSHLFHPKPSTTFRENGVCLEVKTRHFSRITNPSPSTLC